MRRLFLLAMLLGGCTRPLPNGNDCSSYTDLASCEADAACTPSSCPGCNGGSAFGGCYPRGSTALSAQCPALFCRNPECHGLDAATCSAAASRGCQSVSCCGSFLCLDPGEGFGCDCASCHGLDENSCNQRPDCRADTCPGCAPTQYAYLGCSAKSDPPVQCPLLPCPPPPPSCDQLTTESACNVRSDCHAVFEPAGACDCAPAGCCTFFNHCASGPAVCSGAVTCKSLAPNCAGPFVLAYANGCYEGCVRQTECGP